MEPIPFIPIRNFSCNLLTFIYREDVDMDHFSGPEKPTGGSAEVVWRRSSHSAYNGSCVEVADLGHCIAVRDSKAGQRGEVLHVDKAAWAAFLAWIKADPGHRATGYTDSSAAS